MSRRRLRKTGSTCQRLSAISSARPITANFRSRPTRKTRRARSAVDLGSASESRLRVPWPAVKARDILRFQRCQAGFVHLATLGFKCVHFGPKSQLRCAQVLRMASYAVFDVVAAEPKWSCIGPASEGDVNVGMAGI